MRKLFNASIMYVVLGLLAGLYYRELTKARDFPSGEYTQLAVAHTHLLALGFIVVAVVLALEAVLHLSRSKAFNWFFWLYNIGVLATTAIMIWRGTLTVIGSELSKGLDSAISGVAGLGHIFITVAFVFFFVATGKALARTGWKTQPEVAAAA